MVRMPGVNATGERPHPRQTFFPQEQGGAGTGGVPGARAIEDDIPIARQLLIPSAQFIHSHAHSTRDAEAFIADWRRSTITGARNSEDQVETNPHTLDLLCEELAIGIEAVIVSHEKLKATHGV